MKYEITENTKTIVHPLTNKEVTLKQIKALKNFTLINGYKVEVGDLGGWVEHENNLSQEGLCWIYGECCMFDNAMRSDDSIGFERSMQFGDSQQYEESHQFGVAWQYGNSQQYGDSQQYGFSRQYGDSQQYGDSRQHGSSRQFGESHQRGVFKHSYGFHLSCSKSGQLTEVSELIEFNNIGGEYRTINYDKTTRLINVNNCFVGNVDKLEKAVKKKYGASGNYHDVIKMIRAMESN